MVQNNVPCIPNKFYKQTKSETFDSETPPQMFQLSASPCHIQEVSNKTNIDYTRQTIPWFIFHILIVLIHN